MTSPANLADRITAGLHVAPPPLCLGLLCVAHEATAQGIRDASPRLLQCWAGEVSQAAQAEPGMPGQYWASIASALESMAMERSTGEVGR